MAKSVGLLGGSPETALYTYTGHKGPVLTVSWSPDGYQIASGSYDMTVQLWGAFAGQPAFTYTSHKDHVWSVAWSPDGTSIASAGGSYDKTVRVWYAKSGDYIQTFDDYTDGINSVVWSPDGKYIVSGSADGTSRIWNVETWETRYVYTKHTEVDVGSHHPWVNRVQ